ncbi:hypothetical protein CR513_62709, partial [Mucuna pruriens]
MKHTVCESTRVWVRDSTWRSSISTIAVYKACWIKTGCLEADSLAAFDEAIADGLDIISISTGSYGIEFTPYFQSSYNIGGFYATRRGILTSNSAINLGPKIYSMTTYPPWELSVATTTIGRKFLTKVQLGNGMVFEVPLGFQLTPLISKNVSTDLCWRCAQH